MKKIIPALLLLLLVTTTGHAASVNGVVRGDSNPVYTFDATADGRLDLVMTWKQNHSAALVLLYCDVGDLETIAFDVPHLVRGPAKVSLTVLAGSTCWVSVGSSKVTSFTLTVTSSGEDLRMRSAKSVEPVPAWLTDYARALAASVNPR